VDPRKACIRYCVSFVILSDRAIQEAIRAGEIEITPVPIETRYTSSAVDLTLGSQFQGWNFSVLNVQGTRIELNLALQSYQKTAKAFLQSLRTEDDGSFVFPPYTKEPMVLLAQTQERIHLKRDSGHGSPHRPHNPLWILRRDHSRTHQLQSLLLADGSGSCDLPIDPRESRWRNWRD
jgi:hypothetical protein